MLRHAHRQRRDRGRGDAPVRGGRRRAEAHGQECRTGRRDHPRRDHLQRTAAGSHLQPGALPLGNGRRPTGQAGSRAVVEPVDGPARAALCAHLPDAELVAGGRGRRRHRASSRLRLIPVGPPGALRFRHAHHVPRGLDDDPGQRRRGGGQPLPHQCRRHALRGHRSGEPQRSRDFGRFGCRLPNRAGCADQGRHRSGVAARQDRAGGFRGRPDAARGRWQRHLAAAYQLDDRRCVHPARCHERPGCAADAGHGAGRPGSVALMPRRGPRPTASPSRR